MKYLLFYLLMVVAVRVCGQSTKLLLLPGKEVHSTVQVETQVLPQQDGHYQFGWMDSAITHSKVLLLGESHWMQGIQAVLTDLVLYANTQAYYPLLVLEMPYSSTAFVNAYLQADSAGAAKLYPAVQPFFRAAESRQLLETLRHWNAQHPDKPIRIACTDVEQNLGYCLRYIMDPWFKACGNPGLLPLVKREGGITPALMAFIDSVMATAPAGTTVPDMPFLNRNYLQTVVASFKASYEIGLMPDRYGFEYYMKHRLQRICYNLTNDTIFGQQLCNGKAILWGGSAHMRMQQPSADSVRMEGPFLAQEYLPTKGKVYAIRAECFAYNIPMQYYTDSAYKQVPMQGYVHLVDLYKEKVPTYRKGVFSVLDELTPFSAALVQASQQKGGQPLYILQPHVQKAGTWRTALKRDAVWKSFQDYNAVIVLPGATLFSFSTVR